MVPVPLGQGGDIPCATARVPLRCGNDAPRAEIVSCERMHNRGQVSKSTSRLSLVHFRLPHLHGREDSRIVL